MTTSSEAAGGWWRLGPERWLLALAALLLVVALVDPGVSLDRGRFDHVVVLDVTQSMNVTDELIAGQPASRLDFAKQALRGALLKLPCGSKVGWAIFTEYRALLLFAPIEVCANLDELRSTLARIDSRMAWSGNSEIAKGLHSAIVIARELPEKPSLVFVTDGQEAPPINPRYRPAFDDKPGEVPGLIVGVGDMLPSPIPKRDPQGRPLGFWRADEVMQTDPRSQGRATSVPGEKMVDGPADGVAAPMLGATPGREHLSALREGYLQMLAQEQGLSFLRLQTPQGLEAALMAPALAKPLPVRTGGRTALAAVALGVLLLRYLLPWLHRRPRPN
ncbi:vWA domain-containing protein [Variovorax sp. OV329]|uniref:vWA domain-containing protein n=1 Tax=Variovorax sp. OV329 TaxID=1882825 RepID=UPI0008F1ADBA|nr:vWA domain-containing protein [Variovorax sp. OV329]SFL96249.1 mxaL protein [Variovorax sp. OV329]